MSKVIALNSIRGKSGKDTLCELLKAEGRNIKRVAFGDSLKRECADVLNKDPVRHRGQQILVNAMHSSKKDVASDEFAPRNIRPTEYKEWLYTTVPVGEWDKPRSLRWHLQQYGTEFVRVHLGMPDHWVDATWPEVEGGMWDRSIDHVVITDLRLTNEYNKCNNWEPCKKVVVVRDWFIPFVDEQPYHISDIALMAHRFDGLVVNRKGEPWAMLDQLKEQGVIE